MAHEDNLSMTEEIQVWKMPPSLRESVRDLQLQVVILHNKGQEYPSTPLQNPQEEFEDPGREVSPTGKIIIKLKIGAQININTRLVHFLLTCRQLFLRCTQGSYSCNFGNFIILGLLVILESVPHLEKLLFGYSWSYYGGSRYW
jgi:hypothetical protein